MIDHFEEQCNSNLVDYLKKRVSQDRYSLAPTNAHNIRLDSPVLGQIIMSVSLVSGICIL